MSIAYAKEHVNTVIVKMKNRYRCFMIASRKTKRTESQPCDAVLYLLCYSLSLESIEIGIRRKSAIRSIRISHYKKMPD
jgi:hypothetical protein